MTATQVFLRFAKENECYGILYKCLSEAYNHLKHRRVLDKKDSLRLVEMYGDKSFIVDVLLKEMRYSLFNFIYILHANSETFQRGRYFRGINEKWTKYVRENLNGNYFKTMIPDTVKEFESGHDAWGRYRHRNGYHVINFTWKEKKNDSRDKHQTGG